MPVRVPGKGGGISAPVGGEDGAKSARSGTSARSSRSRMPLSARSAGSATSVHVNSYSYLTDKVYDFMHARSTWLGRMQSEREGGGGEEAVLKRLPLDFEPFFAIGTRRPLDYREKKAKAQDGELSSVEEQEDSFIAGWSFQVIFVLFSSRLWDRLYLLLGLLWSVLCPGHLDNVMVVQRTQLGSILLVMFVTAVTPATMAVFLKVFFSAKLRSRLQDSRQFAGVFFVFATKSIPVPALCIHRRWCQRRVHAAVADNMDDQGADTLEGGIGKGRHNAQRTSLGGGSCPPTPSGKRGGGEQERGQSHGRQGKGGGYNDMDDQISHRAERQASLRQSNDGSGGLANKIKPPTKPEVELPPRHWMCTVCKKVNALPDSWDGRATKVMRVVMKRKAVDKHAIYGAFKVKPGVPLCVKCQTPFNYSWRNGGTNDGVQQHTFPLSITPSRPTTAASVDSAGVPSTAMDKGDDSTMILPPNALTKIFGLIRNIFARATTSPKEMGGDSGAVEANAGPELWYGREFRRQLKTYFNPELERPSLFLLGGRYPVGARVACFAGKDAWYPGTVAASRENNTYDVRYDNGDTAQHVFPHMVRFEPIHTDSGLLCCYYGMALVAAMVWPLMGFQYFSSSITTGSGVRAAGVAIPALALGAVGVLAVAAQLWIIYAENRSIGLSVAGRYAAIFAMPSASLALVGGMSTAKALNPSTTGSWVKMLFLPAVLFSLAGGGYAHAVSPAYGNAWASSSLPWLLFLLLVTLRLDGDAGDAGPAFGRMSWLGIYFPLWVLILMLIGAHHVLPYVWKIEVFPEPYSIPGEKTGWLLRLVERLRGAGTAVFRKRKEEDAAKVDDNDDKEHFREGVETAVPL